MRQKLKRNDIDFILKNPNDYPLKLTFHSLENGQLRVEISGLPLSKQYEVRLTELISNPFRKIVQYDSFAPVGSETVKQEGINGTAVTVYRDTYAGNGEKVKTEKISDDFYLPVHQIVVRSIVSATNTTIDTNNNETNQNSSTENSAVEENQTHHSSSGMQTNDRMNQEETQSATLTK